MPLFPASALSYVAPADLKAEDLDAIFALVSQSVRCERDALEASLQANDEVFLYRRGDRLSGFGCIRYFYPAWRGKTHCLILTSRVVVEAAARGQNVIQRAGLGALARRKLEHPFMPVYWVFTAGTYKSYLLLARNFPTYWPRAGATLPEREHELLAQMAAAWGNPDLDLEAGLLRHPNVLYVDQVETAGAAALLDPDVRHFARLNPRQAAGEAVLCLCPLNATNFATMVARMIARPLRLERAAQKKTTGVETPVVSSAPRGT